MYNFKNSDSDKMIVQKCKELIKENYSNSNLDIGKIAAKVHLSTGYLSQIFKQATGTSINKYLINVRLDRQKNC